MYQSTGEISTGDTVLGAEDDQDLVILNAIKSVRAQVADTNKLLAQAQDLQAKLSEKVDVMQRMVNLEERARMELEGRLRELEVPGSGSIPSDLPPPTSLDSSVASLRLDSSVSSLRIDSPTDSMTRSLDVLEASTG